MEQSIIEGITVSRPAEMCEDEARHYVLEEVQLWKARKKRIASIVLAVDAEGFVTVKAKERSPIKRIRRITGYLSQLESFNDAKFQEQADRVTHG